MMVACNVCIFHGEESRSAGQVVMKVSRITQGRNRFDTYILKSAAFLLSVVYDWQLRNLCVGFHWWGAIPATGFACADVPVRRSVVSSGRTEPWKVVVRQGVQISLNTLSCICAKVLRFCEASKSSSEGHR